MIKFCVFYVFNLHKFNENLCSLSHVSVITSDFFTLNYYWCFERDKLLRYKLKSRDFTCHINRLIYTITSRVIKSPRSILASTCRSNGRCAIEKSNNKRPSFEFRVRDNSRATIPPHITTVIVTDAHCQRSGKHLDQYFSVLCDLYNEHRFDCLRKNKPFAKLCRKSVFGILYFIFAVLYFFFHFSFFSFSIYSIYLFYIFANDWNNRTWKNRWFCFCMCIMYWSLALS